MTYLKSALAGFLAVVVVYVVIPALAFGLSVVRLAVQHRAEGFGFTWPRVHVTSPVLFWLFVAMIFSAGFFWELHRLAK